MSQHGKHSLLAQLKSSLVSVPRLAYLLASGHSLQRFWGGAPALHCQFMLERGILALRHRVQALVAADQAFQLQSFAAAAQGAKKQKVTTTKGAKQAASGRDAREESASEKKFKLLLETLAPQDVEEPQLGPEQQAELERRAKEYSRRKMAEERAWQRDLSRKIKLKEAALAALPPKLREAADTPDMTPFPLERMVPTHTPPIKGFSERGRNQKLQQ